MIAMKLAMSGLLFMAAVSALAQVPSIRSAEGFTIADAGRATIGDRPQVQYVVDPAFSN
jgi:hypothetical protein